ncbi:MAG: response regulator transcription factor [Clostridiales Family XIII bacterium]|jgi:DNA-binding response OmpR family regulator|nr:response regulator transcription factor [Clostridiales Family XIII bacterium]
MPDSKRILIVEDNERLNRLNCRALTAEGYDVLVARTLEEARGHLEHGEPDVILLDVMLPDGSGFAFCGEIRDKVTSHILFLTARIEYEEKIEGLKLGGDDYITKPYRLDELLSRVGAALRRREIDARKQDAPPLYGSLALDMTRRRASVKGADMELSPKEFDLLLFFLKNAGKLLRTEEIYAAVWRQSGAGDPNSLRMAISRLRKKIEDGGGQASIEATRSTGYTFHWEV